MGTSASKCAVTVAGRREVGTSKLTARQKHAAALTLYVQELADAQRTVVEARVLGAELQPHTVAALLAEAVETAMFGKGQEGGYALITASSPINKLVRDGEIDPQAAYAAYTFGMVGNQCWGRPAVSIGRYDDAPRGSFDSAAWDPVDVRRLWDEAMEVLSRREAAVLNAVVRFDQGLAEAAHFAGLKGGTIYLTSQAKILLIEACETLRDRWSLGKKAPRVKKRC